MPVKFLILGVLSIPLVAQVSPVPFTESKQSVRAFSAAGEITLPAVRLQVDVPNPAKKERGDLFVIYDPQTGLYAWRYHEIRSPSDSFDVVEPQIISVSKKGELWRLVLRNHWDQELILDSKFNHVSTRQLTLPKHSLTLA